MEAGNRLPGPSTETIEEARRQAGLFLCALFAAQDCSQKF
jgi:hypothetical protein